MDPEFWQQRWRDNQIGFHQSQVTPMLVQHWDSIGAPADARVFVPLAGKSLDMAWLAARGHRVLGVELSPLAIEQFFAERGLTPSVHVTASGIHHCAGGVELVLGDVFTLAPELLAQCDALFDRAALIALPADLRARYANEVYPLLPRECRGLLVTLEYPPEEKDGPPFPVDEAEVSERFGRGWTIDILERRDILAEQPGFVAEGVTALDTVAYRMRRL